MTEGKLSAHAEPTAAAQAVEHLQVSANGQNFYVAASGPVDGPAVMLLHGFPEMSYGWRHQLHALAAAGFRVFAPDQRGYGHSSKPSGIRSYRVDTLAADVTALAKALGHESFSLVGHDWGGIVAWHLAISRAAGLHRLAILNAPHPRAMVQHLSRSPLQVVRSAYVGFFQLPWLPEAALRIHDHALLAKALTSSSLPSTFSDEELAVYRSAWSIDGALTGMLNWYRAALLAPSVPNTKVRVPVRILWGDKDSALEAPLAELSADQCTNAEVIHLPEATHWLHHEASERVNALLIEFLRTPA
jgi:pimeloyl-ACP methyl ester carboxylesterase